MVHDFGELAHELVCTTKDVVVLRDLKDLKSKQEVSVLGELPRVAEISGCRVKAEEIVDNINPIVIRGYMRLVLKPDQESCEPMKKRAAFNSLELFDKVTPVLVVVKLQSLSHALIPWESLAQLLGDGLHLLSLLVLLWRFQFGRNFAEVVVRRSLAGLLQVKLLDDAKVFVQPVSIE